MFSRLVFGEPELKEDPRQIFEPPEATEWRLKYNMNSVTTHWTTHPYFPFGMVFLYLTIVLGSQALFNRKRKQVLADLKHQNEMQARSRVTVSTIASCSSRNSETEIKNRMSIYSEIQKSVEEQADEHMGKIMDRYFGFIRNRGPIFHAYNLLCIALAVTGFSLQMYGVFTFSGFSLVCGGHQNRERLDVWKTAIWVFYISKFVEFFDTFIMVMKLPKSHKQLSFLHIYHHASIPIVLWFYIMRSTGSMEWLPVAANSFIHIIMYSYYFVTGQPWPESHPAKRFVRYFKPVLTSGQLIQFVLIELQSVIGLIYGDGCGWFTHLKWICAVYTATMLWLFGNFFVQSYILPKKAKTE